MPLAGSYRIGEAMLLLWQVEEDEAALRSLVCGSDIDSIAACGSASRRIERLAWRAALRQYGIANEVRYHPDGAPYFEGSDLFISVSHCRGYSVVAVGREACGVDIEKKVRDTAKVLPRYLNGVDEAALSGADHWQVKLWCIKEAAYKYGRRQGVDFKKDISVTRFDVADGSGEVVFPGMDGSPSEKAFRIIDAVEAVLAVIV